MKGGDEEHIDKLMVDALSPMNIKLVWSNVEAFLERASTSEISRLGTILGAWKRSERELGDVLMENLLIGENEPAMASRKKELEFLNACLAIYRNNDGCNTPAEQLICGLVGQYSRGLKSKTVQALVKEFDENLSDGIELARRFASNYPELLTEELTAAAK